jgi:hypothetical protein
MVLPDKYHSKQLIDNLVDSKTNQDGSVDSVFESGLRYNTHPNGTKHRFWPDGYTVIQFPDNSMKQLFPSGKAISFDA